MIEKSIVPELKKWLNMYLDSKKKKFHIDTIESTTFAYSPRGVHNLQAEKVMQVEHKIWNDQRHVRGRWWIMHGLQKLDFAIYDEGEEI